MRRVPISEISEAPGLFDTAAEATPNIDAFCSGSPWALSAHEALMPARRDWIFEYPGGYVALAAGTHASAGPYLQPLEAAWGLASPVIGPSLPEATEALSEVVFREVTGWRLLALSGLPSPSPLFNHLTRALLPRGHLGRGSPSLSRYASLEGGLEGFLSRRSAKHRATLRRAHRAFGRLGIELSWIQRCSPSAVGRLYDRIQSVERQSWKGREEVGIQSGAMHAFYAQMLPRLARAGKLRVLFATQGGRDLAYLFGAVSGDSYRGLQMSFDESMRRHSLGSALQLAAIERLATEGVQVYDLGQDIPYKERWSDGLHRYETLYLMR